MTVPPPPRGDCKGEGITGGGGGGGYPVWLQFKGAPQTYLLMPHIRSSTPLSHSGFCSAPTLDPQNRPELAQMCTVYNPKGSRYIFGRVWSKIWAQNWPKWPKTSPTGSIKGQSWAFRGAKQAKTGPKLPKFAPQTFPEHLGSFLGKTVFDLFSVQAYKLSAYAP